MRQLYSLLVYMALPFIFVRLLWKARKNIAYAKRWGERVAFLPSYIPQNVLWWHSVSTGETLASLPLLKSLRKIYPDLSVLITTTTPSGSEQLKKHLLNSQENKTGFYHCYLPYDTPCFMKKTLKRLRPRLLVLMETELWPNLLHHTWVKNIPVIIVNARLSKKSAKNYARFLSLTRNMLKGVTKIAAQSPSDAKRFQALGMSAEKITVTGSVKCDSVLSETLVQKARALREQLYQDWGEIKPVWIAASTREGEEDFILKAACELPQALLILAPRHPERTAFIISLCKKAGLSVCLRTEVGLPDHKTRVFLINTLGELPLFYGLSDVAFIGGSFVPTGGHNMLEPAAWALPLLTGLSSYNFSSISSALVHKKALIKIKNPDQLGSYVKRLFENPELCQQMGRAAKKFMLDNQGACQKTLALLAPYLQKN